jgi:uncharacterized membrane-anchored protein YitT (DUF2179 family)
MAWVGHPGPHKVLRSVEDYLLITAGALIAAAGVDLFLTPNKVVSAGVTGIAMLAHFSWKWPVGLVALVLNLPLFLAAIRWGGASRRWSRPSTRRR